MSWSLMSSSPLILLTGLFWIVLWVAWDYLIGFVRFIFLFIVRFVSGSSLLLVLVNRGVGMMVSLSVVPLNMVFVVALYVPWCRHLDALPDVKRQLYADNLKCSAERPCALFDSAFLILLDSLLSMFGLLVRMSLLEKVSFLALLSLFGEL